MSCNLEKSHPNKRSMKDRGFTLFEILVVVGLILFLSRLTFFHFAGGPQAQQLEATIKNLGAYYNSASQTAYSAKQWVVVVVNIDPASEGYLRQFGTYKWFRGHEPFDDDNGDGAYGNSEDYLDINGNDTYDDFVTGWVSEDVKGHWLPEKIFFDLERSGAANYTGKEFKPEKSFPSSGKFQYFAMEHETNVGPNLDDVFEVGRIPYFIDRSGYRASDKGSGDYKILQTSNSGNQHDSPLKYEIHFSDSKSADEWLLFIFDENGRYVNLENPMITGGSLNRDAQRDFIVLSQGVINYQAPNTDIHKIKPIRGREVPGLASFMMHQSGIYTIIEDETQIPQP